MNVCDQSITESINIIWLIEKIQEQNFSFFNNGFIKQENNSSVSNDKYLDSILDTISVDLMNQMKILKSEIDIDNIFNASFIDNKEKYLKDNLRHKLESENFKEKIELFRQSGIVKTNRTYSYSTKILDKENVDLESLLQENLILKKENEEYKSKQIEYENKLFQEKNEELIQIQSCLTQSNQDLEDQINECFELYSQIKTFKDNECNFHNSLLSLISKFGCIPETTLTTVDLFELMNKYLDNNKQSQINASCPSNDAMNDSILDLEQFHTDSICTNDSPCRISAGKTKPKSKLPKLFPSSRKSNSGNSVNSSSFLNLDSFYLNDSKDDSCILSDKSDNTDSPNLLSDKLDKLDWEDVDKMEMLVEKSFHIFTDAIIDLYSNKGESFVEKLKNCINEFGQILTSKVKNCQFKKIDLNSTCIFEKLEHELQLEAANVELSEQLTEVLTEKSRIELELENERLGNQSLNSKLKDYLDTISYLEDEKNRIFENNSIALQSLHTEISDLKLANTNLENSLIISTETVESYGVQLKHCATEIEKLANENQNLQSEIIILQEIKEKLSSTSDLLNISEENLKTLLNELEERNKLVNQLEEKLSSLEKVDTYQCLIDLEQEKAFCEINEEINGETTELQSPFDDSFHLSNEFGNPNDCVPENKTVISESTREEIDKLKVDLKVQKEQFQILEAKLEEKENIVRDILNKQLTWLSTNDELEKQLEIKESELTKAKLNFDEIKLENFKNAYNFQTEKSLMQAEIDENLNVIENLKSRLKDELNNNDNEEKELAICLQNIENENNNFKLRLLEKENMISNFTEELKIRNDEIVSLKQQLKFTEEAISTKTQKEALEEETVNSELMAKYGKLEKDFEKLKLLMLEKENEIINLKEDIIGLRLKLEGYENELIEETENRIEIKNLTLNLETKEIELVNLKNMHEFINEKLDLALEINRRLEEQIADLNSGSIKTLSEKEEKITSLHDNVNGLQLKLERYETRLVEGEKNLIEMGNLRVYLETKEIELIRLQNEHKDIVEKRNLLLEINRSLEEKMEDLNTNLVQNSEELGEEIKCLKIELSQKQEVISQMSDEKAAVELDMEFLKNQLKLTLEKIEEDREEFELINVNAKKTEAQLEMELEKSVSDFQSLQNNFLICQNLLKEKDNEIKIITEANEIIENELELSKIHLGKVKLESVYKEQEFIRVKDNFEAISNELAIMKGKEQLLELALNSVKDDAKSQYENEIESLRKQISELKMPDEMSRKALQLEIDKLKCELREREKLIASQTEAVQTFDVLVGHYNDLKTRYRTKRAQIEALDAKLKQVKDERDNFKRLLYKD